MIGTILSPRQKNKITGKISSKFDDYWGVLEISVTDGNINIEHLAYHPYGGLEGFDDVHQLSLEQLEDIASLMTGLINK